MNKFKLLFLVFALGMPCAEVDASANFVDGAGVEWEKKGDFAAFITDLHLGCGVVRNCELFPIAKDATQVSKIILGAYNDGSKKLHITLKSENKDLRQELASHDLTRKYTSHSTLHICEDRDSLPGFLEAFKAVGILDQSLIEHIMQIMDVTVDPIQGRAAYVIRSFLPVSILDTQASGYKVKTDMGIGVKQSEYITQITYVTVDTIQGRKDYPVRTSLPVGKSVIEASFELSHEQRASWESYLLNL